MQGDSVLPVPSGHLDDALKTYRQAKDAQSPDQAPSTQLTDATKTWQDALKAYRQAEDEFRASQDKQLTVTTPTVQLRAAAAQLDKATHDKVKTHVIAPAKGIVSNLSLRPGAPDKWNENVFVFERSGQGV